MLVKVEEHPAGPPEPTGAPLFAFVDYGLRIALPRTGLSAGTAAGAVAAAP